MDERCRMKIGLFGLNLLAIAGLGGCGPSEASQKAQVRDQMVAQCQQQVQMMVQGGMGDFSRMCPCIATAFDNMSVEQFRQISENPMTVANFKQQLSTQCLQQAGGLGGMGGMGGMGAGGMGGMGGGMQQPGLGYGGAAKGANTVGASNSAQ